MNLHIIGDWLARVKVDMKNFKEDFKKTLCLEDSIRKNFTVIENRKREMFKEEMLFKMVYNLLDWGRLLDLINEVDKDVMEVRFFSCEFTDKVEVAPHMVSADGRYFVFKQEMKSGTSIILINSFINSPDYDIASWLISGYFNYGFKGWMPMVEWEGIK